LNKTNHPTKKTWPMTTSSPSSLALSATLQGAVLFALISSPWMYRTTQKLADMTINKLLKKRPITLANAEGLPTGVGLAVHTAVFSGLVLLAMKAGQASKVPSTTSQ